MHISNKRGQEDRIVKMAILYRIIVIISSTNSSNISLGIVLNFISQMSCNTHLHHTTSKRDVIT
jgi:hypothetical protein